MNAFQNLTRLKKSASTRLITAENVYGEKSCSSMAASRKFVMIKFYYTIRNYTYFFSF